MLKILLKYFILNNLFLLFIINSYAVEKKKCSYISKKNLIKLYKKKIISKDEVKSILKTRRIKAKKGENLIDILKKDKFKYSKKQNILKWIKRKNKLKSNKLTKNKIITLPICSKSEILKNKKVSKKKKKKKRKSEIIAAKKAKGKKLSFGVGTQAGYVSVSRAEKSLTLIFSKVSTKVTYKLTENDSISMNLALQKVFNVTHSDAVSSINPPGAYSETGFSYITRIGSFSLAHSYDYLNYFVFKSATTVVDISLTPLHRFALKPFYLVNKNYGVFGGVGILKNFGENNISGIDLSIGGTYFLKLGKRPLALSGVLYQSSLNTDLSDESEKSNAAVLSLSLGF